MRDGWVGNRLADMASDCQLGLVDLPSETASFIVDIIQH